MSLYSAGKSVLQLENIRLRQDFRKQGEELFRKAKNRSKSLCG